MWLRRNGSANRAQYKSAATLVSVPASGMGKSNFCIYEALGTCGLAFACDEIDERRLPFMAFAVTNVGFIGVIHKDV